MRDVHPRCWSLNSDSFEVGSTTDRTMRRASLGVCEGKASAEDEAVGVAGLGWIRGTAGTARVGSLRFDQRRPGLRYWPVAPISVSDETALLESAPSEGAYSIR